MSFLGEIKRRKVFQVAAVYAVVAWLIIQIIDVVSEPLNLPDWLDTVVIVLLAVGFPIAVVLAWAFDLTSDGVVRDDGGVSTPSSGRRIKYVLIGLLVVAVGWLVYRDIGPSGGLTGGDDDVLRNSVAVLPFDNLSPDPDNAYFAAGIHESILNELSKIRDMSVIARTSVLRYADGTTPIPEIAAELNVETVMEGSVRYDGDRVRITAQLIDPATGAHLWSDEYDRDLKDIFAIQSDIAERIAMALEAELSVEEQQRIGKALTSSHEAFSLYLRATNLGVRFPLGFGPNDDLHRYLDQAIELDPGFARAHALKAHDYAFAMVRSRLPDDPEIVELERLAYEHAARALSLDSEENLAYVAMANINRFNWRATEAEGAFLQALRLAPNDFASLRSFAHFLSFLEEYERAIALAKRAIEIDPFGKTVLATVYRRAGNFDAAYVAYNDVLRVHPSNPNVHDNIAIVEWHRGNADAALKSVQNAERLISDGDSGALSELIQTYGLLGRREDALRLLNSLEQVADTYHVSATDWARAYLGTGDYEQALTWLKRVDEDRSPEDSIAGFSIAINSTHDPALERPEFLDIRNRLALRK